MGVKRFREEDEDVDFQDASGGESDDAPSEIGMDDGDTEAEDDQVSGQSESSSEDSSDSENQDVPFSQRVAMSSDAQANHGGARRAKRSKKPAEGGETERGRKKFSRENKNRPTEQTSKRPVPRYREVVEVGKRTIRDPRFDDMAGKLQEDVFKQRYSFLYDETLQTERSDLKKRLHKSKSAAQKQALKADLTRVQQQLRNEESRRKRKELQAAAKAKETQAVKEGKKRFFLKKSEKKKQELIQKYQELKSTGRLQKAIEKKRKKNAQKDRRYMPSAL